MDPCVCSMQSNYEYAWLSAAWCSVSKGPILIDGSLCLSRMSHVEAPAQGRSGAGAFAPRTSLPTGVLCARRGE